MCLCVPLSNKVTCCGMLNFYCACDCVTVVCHDEWGWYRAHCERAVYLGVSIVYQYMQSQIRARTFNCCVNCNNSQNTIFAIIKLQILFVWNCIPVCYTAYWYKGCRTLSVKQTTVTEKGKWPSLGCFPYQATFYKYVFCNEQFSRIWLGWGVDSEALSSVMRARMVSSRTWATQSTIIEEPQMKE